MDLKMKKDKNRMKDTIYMPKNKNQEKYIDYLNNDSVNLIIAIGPAGTGKTLFACLKAITQLKNGEITKLIVTRPIVPVEEEEIGFLPGSLVKKMDPWTKPIFDLFLEFFSKRELDDFINNNIIEIAPLGFMRGRTFKNSFIIADEMQNSSPGQMKMLATRIGENTKMVITGDLNQTDIKFSNGLEDLINKVNYYNRKIEGRTDMIQIVNFENEDIERSELVKKIIEIYENNTQIVFDKNTINNTQQKITNNTIKHNNYLDNDAALIPKRHITKNTDIFFNEL
jgi:phosphate starvation-inducible PhoH-like protein